MTFILDSQARLASWVAMLTVTIWMVLPGLAKADFNPDNRISLKDLTGVYVLVEKVTDQATRVGLTEAIIRADVEKQLAEAGIPVLTKKEFVGVPGAPRLYIQLNTAEYTGRFLWSSRKIAFSIRLELGQLVKLSRDMNREFYAATWQTGMVGYADEGELDSAREDITRLVIMFIEAWRVAGKGM